MNIEIGLLTLGPNLTDCGKPDFPKKKIKKKWMDVVNQRFKHLFVSSLE